MRGIVPAKRDIWISATRLAWLLTLPVLAAGCAKNPFTGVSTAAARVAPPGTVIGGVAQGQDGQTWQGRATALDVDNQQSKKMLAQSRQHVLALRETSDALRDELKIANDRLAQLTGEKAAGDKKIASLEASTRTGAGAFQPNNGLKKELEPIRLQGVEVRMDGDVVRVELLHEKLFTGGSETISAEGHSLIDSVIAELQRSHPDNIIGIEGHTASKPGSPLGGDAVALRRSLLQASAVFEYLTGRLRVSSKQLLVVGHGPNHPVFSNATAAGRRRNNRVELVIYPERYR